MFSGRVFIVMDSSLKFVIIVIRVMRVGVSCVKFVDFFIEKVYRIFRRFVISR